MHPLQPLLNHPSQLLVPLALLVATVLGGIVVRIFLFRTIRAWAGGSESNLVDMIVESLPIVLWSMILGLHLATQNSGIPKADLKYIPKTLAVLWILSLTIAISRLVGNVVQYYGGVAHEQSVTSITRKLAQIAIVLMGLAALLRVFNVSLAPILTTLGVGGLAVALALQDTLSNLFAGFYVSISGLVHIGDYIKLNTGEEGYIADINWRATTMRGSTNNLVIIPNNKLGQAIYTNYNLPDQRMGMSISISVGYDSDVDRVQGILLAETLAATGQVQGLLADPAPYVLFSPGAGESALVFQVNFSVAEFAVQYVAQSELRKRLFKKLKENGITMPFPTRTIHIDGKLDRSDTDQPAGKP
jgi:small-conductance mechanosensitive channel